MVIGYIALCLTINVSFHVVMELDCDLKGKIKLSVVELIDDKSLIFDKMVFDLVRSPNLT